MLKLLHYEQKKLLNSKIYIFIFVALLIANIFLMDQNIYGKNINLEKNMTAFLIEYKKDPASMERYIADYKEAYYAAIQDDALPYPNDVYSDSDNVLFNEFLNLYNQNH